MGDRLGGTPRVLVADDDRDEAEALGLLLRQLGCDTRVVYSGQEATALAPEFRPDLVVLDITMPGMDGYETAIVLRRQAWSIDTVYVAHTISRDALVAETVRKLGFHHHVPKPGTIVDFAAIVLSMRYGHAVPAPRVPAPRA
ncbi:MAG TPA: response regulator [Casimicrobiaceae bacterium]